MMGHAPGDPMHAVGSEQTEDRTDKQIDYEAYQESHEAAEYDVADLVLVRRHVDDDDHEQYDQSQYPTEYPS